MKRTLDMARLARSYREMGAVLAMSLIVLLLLTLLATAAITHAVLELRMAGNVANQAMAFEAAEYALAMPLPPSGLSTENTAATPLRIPADAPDLALPTGAGRYRLFVHHESIPAAAPLAGGGYSLGVGLDVEHFVATATGLGPRDAVSEQSVGFYVVVPVDRP